MAKGLKPINTCKWENGRRGLPKQEELMCWRASPETWFSFSWWAYIMIANKWEFENILVSYLIDFKWRDRSMLLLYLVTISVEEYLWLSPDWSNTISSCEKLEEEQRCFFSGPTSCSAGTGCVGRWSWILDGATLFCTTTAQRHCEQNAYYQQTPSHNFFFLGHFIKHTQDPVSLFLNLTVSIESESVKQRCVDASSDHRAGFEEVRRLSLEVDFVRLCKTLWTL